MDLFFGRTIGDWMKIYSLMKFRGDEPKSFKDLYSWLPPQSPSEVITTAFELAEADAAKYENPVPKWIENILSKKPV